MNRRNWFIILILLLAVGILPWSFDPAQAGPGLGIYADGTPGNPTFYANSPAGTWTDFNGVSHPSGTAIRKFVDPLPGICGPAGTPIPAISWTPGSPAVNKCIPLANPNTTLYPGSDYYEIGIVEYTEPMHADLPKATKLRGYVQLNDPANPVTPANAHTIARYLGPIIVAQKGRPVRIKYTNLLPTGPGGELFIPVDETLMGAGYGPDGLTKYTHNRISIHLHGGYTPWISDGTPHQWIVPVGEPGLPMEYMIGPSFEVVPDMSIPSQGSGTLYYTNEQAARLMFYHDHAWGITRLNVYVGMAAGYLIQDLAGTGEWTLPETLTMPDIPLVIQDKTFVPADIATQDARWDTTHWGVYGDLWFPHVYETNQDPASLDGTNPVGRWDWGPWFWPVFPSQYPLPTGVRGDATTTPEAFMDTPVVNGTAYPTLTVDPKAYRFRILNAANDRFFNLQLYKATSIVNGITLTSGGSGYTAPPIVTITPAVGDVTGKGAKATATVASGQVTSVTLFTVGSGYTSPPTVTIAPPASGVTATATATIYSTSPVPGVGMTEVGMVPFDATGTFPTTGGLVGTGWGFPDSRDGGVPDPATAGPDIIQIGSEGGLLPEVVIIPSTPINYEYNRRSVTVLNVLEHGLYLGPAERADVIVDFSRFAGQTLILYNDAPAPVPAGDPRLDYYTGGPDQSAFGGAASIPPGYGPNTRTIMQIKVTTNPAAPAYNVALLAAALPAA